MSNKEISFCLPPKKIRFVDLFVFAHEKIRFRYKDLTLKSICLGTALEPKEKAKKGKSDQMTPVCHLLSSCCLLMVSFTALFSCLTVIYL